MPQELGKPLVLCLQLNFTPLTESALPSFLELKWQLIQESKALPGFRLRRDSELMSIMNHMVC